MNYATRRNIGVGFYLALTAALWGFYITNPTIVMLGSLVLFSFCVYVRRHWIERASDTPEDERIDSWFPW